MSDQGNAKRKKSVWKQIKHSVVGSKKEREKKRLHQLMEEHPTTGKAAGFGVAPRNSIIRSPEATKMVFEEFEHSSPSEPGHFDIDDEMGGADVTEDSRPPRKVPPPETPTLSLLMVAHEDEGIAKDPVMGEGTPAVALEGLSSCPGNDGECRISSRRHFVYVYVQAPQAHPYLLCNEVYYKGTDWVAHTAEYNFEKGRPQNTIDLVIDS